MAHIRKALVRRQIEVQEDSNGWTCQRALTARNNIIIDVATCGSFLPGGSAVDLAEQIAAKVARQ